MILTPLWWFLPDWCDLMRYKRKRVCMCIYVCLDVRKYTCFSSIQCWDNYILYVYCTRSATLTSIYVQYTHYALVHSIPRIPVSASVVVYGVIMFYSTWMLCIHIYNIMFDKPQECRDATIGIMTRHDINFHDIWYSLFYVVI